LIIDFSVARPYKPATLERMHFRRLGDRDRK
jgi:hypothetical protein